MNGIDRHTTSPEIRALIRKAQDAGWLVEMTKSHHIRFRAPHGTIVITPGTTGDVRAFKNARARLRRAGLDV